MKDVRLAKYSTSFLKASIPTSIKRKQPIYVITAVLAVLVLATLPFYVDVDASYAGYFLFIAFTYIILAQGWNLVAGYTGLISLGGNAFFGLGAYTTAIIWLRDITKTGYYFDPVVMILSGLVPVVVAIIIGIPLLARLRGDYFAFGTLGAGQILYVVALKAQDLTGGAMGLHLPSTVFDSMRPYYWVSFLLALFSIAVVYFITTSRIGLALRAIKEDETSAASHGVHVLKYKIFAFAVGAFFAGIGGSLYSYYLFTIQPSSILNLNWVIYPILMCVLGGNGTIVGPIIGAFFVSALFSFGEVYFTGYQPIVSGVLIILVMKFMPSGIIGFKDRILSRR